MRALVSSAHRTSTRALRAINPTQLRKRLRLRRDHNLRHSIVFVKHDEHADAAHAVALLRAPSLTKPPPPTRAMNSRRLSPSMAFSQRTPDRSDGVPLAVPRTAHQGRTKSCCAAECPSPPPLRLCRRWVISGAPGGSRACVGCCPGSYRKSGVQAIWPRACRAGGCSAQCGPVIMISVD